MFNFSARIESLLADLKGLNKKNYWLDNTLSYLFEDYKKRKEKIFEFNKEITKKYYIKKRVKQILDSLDVNVRNELKIFKRNLEIIKSNIKIVNEDLIFLNELIEKTKENKAKKEVRVLKSLFSRLEKLLKVKSVVLMNLYLEFSEELINRKKSIVVFRKFLDNDLSSDNLLLLLKELYLNFKLLEDFYFSFKIELSQKMEKINNEVYLLEKRIEEKVNELMKKTSIFELKKLKTKSLTTFDKV
jgi:hypothetical protein